MSKKKEDVSIDWLSLTIDQADVIEEALGNFDKNNARNTLFSTILSRINILRVAGREKIADQLEEKIRTTYKNAKVINFENT